MTRGYKEDDWGKSAELWDIHWTVMKWAWKLMITGEDTADWKDCML
jgi:hypothetical protein